MNSYLNSSTQSTILAKITKYSKYMSDKIKLYLDLVLDSLFTKESGFSVKIMKEMHELMEDENQRVYIQYSFLVKKAFMKFEQKGPLRKVPKEQLENFAFFFRRIFEKEEDRPKINDFLMYSLLRFASFIETKEKESLIERFRGFPLVDRPKFWRAVLHYMSKHIYKHLNNKKATNNEKKESSNTSFIKSVQGFFKINKSQTKDNATKPSQIKSFEEISSLLFRIRLEFDGIVDILLLLGRDCHISATLIRQILNRNKEVLLQQMTDLTKVKLTKKDLESLKSVRSYDSVIRRAKGLEPRRSINLKSVEGKQVEKMAREFEQKTEQKTSKLVTVLKLSLGFLVGRYDEEGRLVRKEPSASLQEMLASNVSRNDSKLQESEEPTVADPKGSKVKNILDSVRSYEIKGIDDFLESATKISQASRPQSPKKKKKKEKKEFNLEEKKISVRKQEWMAKYRDCDDSVVVDLAEVFRWLMVSRRVYFHREDVVRKVLLTVWPLSEMQRKFLYIELTSDSLSQNQLLDYEEQSYAFTRVKSKDPLSRLGRSNRQFGESFMKVDRKKGELIDPIKNDFDTLSGKEDDKTEEGSEVTPKKVLTSLAKEETNLIQTTPPDNPFLSVVEKPSPEGSELSKPKVYQNKQKHFQSEMPGIRKIPNRHRSKSRTKNTLPTKLKKQKQKPKPADNIITLDVKRTHVERKEFDHVSLEQVLRNISHPKVGNFAYYQGLNYIVAYVLDIIHDPVETYNVSIMLMETHFRKYVNHNMDNLNILFYILRRLVQVFLPELAAHIDRNENMEANATYANWFLTLFTTLKQFKENVRLLDQVFDIFMAKGWVGFFKCVLVIFYYLEEDILALQSEEMIMFLNDFTKKGFERLGETLQLKSRKVASKASLKMAPSESSFTDIEKKQLSSFDSQSTFANKPLFNFKQEINEFKMVNKLLLVEFSMEYHNMREAVEKKWIEILRRIDTHTNSK